MKFYLIGDNIFYPAGKDYLIYVCKKDELEGMTVQEATERVLKMLLDIKEQTKPLTLN